MVRRHRQIRHRPRLAPKPKQGDSFSLLELVVIIGILITIGFITLPMLFQFIKFATYTASKEALYGARKECLISSGRYKLLEMNGVTFSTSNPQDTCNSVITASFQDECTISLDLRTGRKTSANNDGWPNTYEECVSQQKPALDIAEQQGQPAADGEPKESDVTETSKNQETPPSNTYNKANFNDGEGSFTESRISDMKKLDVNGDGIPEIISTGRTGTYIHYQLDGEWKSTKIGRGTSRPSLTIGDIDNDGKEDIIITDSEGLIFYLKNKGDYNLNDLERWSDVIIAYPSKDGPQGLTSTEISDINNDGIADLLVTGQYDNSVYLYTGNSSSGSSPYYFRPQMITSDEKVVGMAQVKAADLDGDGKKEIIAAGDDLWIYKQTQSGDWEQTSQLRMGNSGFEVKDIDDDGDLDILGGFGSTIQWYENNGSGTNLEIKELAKVTVFKQGSKIVGGSSSFTMEDVDGDGDLDIASASRGGKAISWYENIGSAKNPKYSEGQVLIEKEFSGANSVLMGDFDGDGDTDIAGGAYAGKGGNMDNRRLLIFKNN